MRKLGENRGGARERTGPKPTFQNSDQFRQELRRACNRAARKTGESVADRLVELAYSGNKQTAMPALKLIFASLLTQQSEAHVSTTVTGPSISLPELQPDPAKLKSVA